MGLVYTANGKTKDYTAQLEKKVKALETAIEQKEDNIIEFKQYVEKLEAENTKLETEKAKLEKRLYWKKK
jgi:septal ring factor EnvC (AmiA/AmiB activator)